jgi:hypothetical protein
MPDSSFSSSSSSSSKLSIGSFDFEHHHFAYFAMAATLAMALFVAYAFWSGQLSNAQGPENPELLLRVKVARGYVRSTAAYIAALEGVTQNVLDIKSDCWRQDERADIALGHEMLVERTRNAAATFRQHDPSANLGAAPAKPRAK